MMSKIGRRKVARNPSSLPRSSFGLERQDDLSDADERKLLGINRRPSYFVRLTD